MCAFAKKDPSFVSPLHGSVTDMLSNSIKKSKKERLLKPYNGQATFKCSITEEKKCIHQKNMTTKIPFTYVKYALS